MRFTGNRASFCQTDYARSAFDLLNHPSPLRANLVSIKRNVCEALLKGSNVTGRGKTCIFIDGNNLFHAARAVNVEVDYARLLDYLTGEDGLLRASFYTGVRRGDDDQVSRQQGFLYWMRRNGFRVIEKDLKRTADGGYRASLDVEIATDMMGLNAGYDTAILVSGSEDFSYAMEAVARLGKRVEVAMFRSSVSQRLIESADAFIDLENAVDDLAKDPASYTPKSQQRFEQYDDEYDDEGYDDDEEYGNE